MKSAYWQKWNETYRNELLTNVMPFWMKHGWDRKNGGVYTCVDRDGKLMDSTKSGWFQTKAGYWINKDYVTVLTEDEAEEEPEDEPAPKREAMVRCVFCGATFPKDSLVCPVCGKKR